MLRTAATRVLDHRDLPAVLGLLGADPVAHVFVRARVLATGLDPWRLGAQMWGYPGSGTLRGACYAGANMVPVGTDPGALAAFAERARRQGRRCSSVFGLASSVLPLWSLLAPAWGPPRELRPDQPLLAIEGPPACPADPAVRLVRLEELDQLVPASIAMYTEEVGVSPVGSEGPTGGAFRARVAELVQAGRAFARIERGQVLFKAEVGAATPEVCQVQGVWVHPDWRGRGLGSAGTAAVVELCRAQVAPVVSLYVNAFNTAARRAYHRVGFHRVDTFASVLF